MWILKLIKEIKVSICQYFSVSISLIHELIALHKQIIIDFLRLGLLNGKLNAQYEVLYRNSKKIRSLDEVIAYLVSCFS